MAGSGAFALVLAAGRGRRLAGLTVRDGEVVPKQFCALEGRTTLLRSALTRAAGLVGRERVVVVVAAEHRRWWRSQLWDIGGARRVVQPMDRGTAAGILLPVLTILRHDPMAPVLVLPSDHFVAREMSLRRGMRLALEHVGSHAEEIVLVGLVPEVFDPDLGWVLPDPLAAGPIRTVAAFREKPGADEARRLRAAGALVNTFIFAVRTGVLVDLYRELLPEVVEPLEATEWESGEALEAVYRRMPVRDFSRHLLERAAPRLRLLEASPCGWSDLGTPERVARCLASMRRGLRESGRGGSRDSRGPLELAARVRPSAASL